MVNTETIKNLERRYHVHINKEVSYGPWWNGGKVNELFKVYSADGCHWDSVIGYRSLIHTLAEDKESLNRIYNDVLARRNARKQAI